MTLKSKFLRALAVVALILGLGYLALWSVASRMYQAEIEYIYEQTFLPDYMRHFHKKQGKWPDASAALRLEKLDNSEVQGDVIRVACVKLHRERVERIDIDDAQKDRIYYTIRYKNGAHATWHADLINPVGIPSIFSR